jgi:hypothetical protein
MGATCSYSDDTGNLTTAFLKPSREQTYIFRRLRESHLQLYCSFRTAVKWHRKMVWENL